MSKVPIHNNAEQTGIVYLDLNNDKNVVKILEKLAPEFPDIVFMKIDVKISLYSHLKINSNKQ